MPLDYTIALAVSCLLTKIRKGKVYGAYALYRLQFSRELVSMSSAIFFYQVLKSQLQVCVAFNKVDCNLVSDLPVLVNIFSQSMFILSLLIL